MGGGGPGAAAVQQRLAAYVDRLGRSLARDPEGGWLGGPTCRPDVFATLFRHLLALHASAAPAPSDSLRSLLVATAPAHPHPLHPMLAAALACLDAPLAPPPVRVQPAASGPDTAEGSAEGGAAGGPWPGLLFLLSTAV
jgi:hypothetical protein